MQFWKYLFEYWFASSQTRVQHLEKCLELNQPIIIHTLSKIEEDSD